MPIDSWILQETMMPRFYWRRKKNVSSSDKGILYEIMEVLRLEEFCPVLGGSVWLHCMLIREQAVLLCISVFTCIFKDRKWQIRRQLWSQWALTICTHPLLSISFHSFLYKISLFNSIHFPISKILIFASLQQFLSGI